MKIHHHTRRIQPHDSERLRNLGQPGQQQDHTHRPHQEIAERQTPSDTRRGVDERRQRTA